MKGGMKGGTQTERHPTPDELLSGTIRTIEDVLVPELHSDWARTCAMGLVGQLRYALARQASDSLAVQDAELEECLNGLLEEFAPLREAADAAEAIGERSWDLRERAGRLLIFALEGESDAAVAVRTRLRPLLRAHVTADLGETGPMLQAFLVSGSLGSTG